MRNVHLIVPFICVISLGIGIASATLISIRRGLAIAVLAPIALAYAAAWSGLAPHPQTQTVRPDEWSTLAAIYWAAWGTPVSLIGYVAARFLGAHRGRAL